MTGVFPLVPARGGSERIPDKNLAEVGGVPLLVRAVRTVREAFGRCLVSTDRAGYAALARAHGADVPGLRPASLATPATSMEAVVRHAVRHWAAGETVVVVVQPTSPFVTASDLHALVGALRPPATSALLGTAAPAEAAFLLVEREPGRSEPVAPDLFPLRTQEVPRLWQPTGGGFAAPLDRLAAGGDLVVAPVAVVEVPPERAIDIDTAADLARAREAAG